MELAKVELKGDGKLLRKFFNAGRNMYKELDESFEKSARIMQESIKSHTPVGETGNLQDSIEVQKRRNSHYSIGSQSEYAVPIEYGTGLSGDPATQHSLDFKGINPQYNFTNAFNASKKEVLNTVQKAFKEALDD